MTGKRVRRHASEESQPDPDAPADKQQKSKKTIPFEDINAENRDWRTEEIYTIIEFPVGSSIWHILRCAECDLVFSSARGCATHLGGPAHQGSRKWDMAVERLGIEVVDCDESKAARNNAAFKEACKQGHRPKRHLQKVRFSDVSIIHQTPGDDDHEQPAAGLTQQERQASLATDVPHTNDGGSVPSENSQVDSFLGVTEPVLGQIYQAYWPEDETWYRLTVLPLGGFQEIGLFGHLSDLDLSRAIPACYEVEQGGSSIIGWKDGFGASGPRVSEREFPCLVFDEAFEIPATGKFSLPDRRRYAWVSAKDLRPLDYRQPGGHRFKGDGHIAATKFSERMTTVRNPSLTAQPEADMIGHDPGSGSGSRERDQDISSQSPRDASAAAVHKEPQGSPSSPRSPLPERPQAGPRGRLTLGWHQRQRDELYCRNWVRTGQCIYIRGLRGCRYKHEMPDSQTRRDLGLGEELPRWWMEEQERGWHRRSVSRGPPACSGLRPGSHRWSAGS